MFECRFQLRTFPRIIGLSRDESMDDFLYAERADRVSLCTDHRPYIRIPARGLRGIARVLWTTFSWTTVFLPLIPMAIAVSKFRWSPDCVFWLNLVALLPLFGAFRYSTEVLSAAASPNVGRVWDSTLGAFNLDLAVRRAKLSSAFVTDKHAVDRLHRHMAWAIDIREVIHSWQSGGLHALGKHQLQL